MNEQVKIDRVSFEFAEQLQRLVSEHAVAETTWAIPHPYPENGAWEWIRDALQKWETEEAYGFFIFANGEFVGSVSILNIEGKKGELGYWIGQPYWGNGYATVGAGQALAFAFEKGGLQEVSAQCLARNIGSSRVLEKLGFEFTGYGEVSLPKWPKPERTKSFVLLKRPS